jgi:hypothetical protein
MKRNEWNGLVVMFAVVMFLLTCNIIGVLHQAGTCAEFRKAVEDNGCMVIFKMPFNLTPMNASDLQNSFIPLKALEKARELNDT